MSEPNAWGPSLLSTDPAVTAGYAYDASRFTGHVLPVAVLAPRSTEEVVDAVLRARGHGLSVVPRGAGSGLSGGANAIEDSVVVSLHRMDRILRIDASERIAVVQPGVVTADLRAAAAEAGLFYPPDPGSVAFSTVGGNVSTNAGGMCCLKYGVTADFVLGLEVVLADGRVLRTGRTTAKGVAGYDLTRLFVGSEGTLGIVTEITVRLLPAPQPSLTLVATFDSLASAGDAVARVSATGAPLSMLEILDRTTLTAIDEMTQMDFGSDVQAMLLMACDEAGAAQVLERVSDLCVAARACDVVVGDDPAESDQLLAARRLALPALERWGDCLVEDACVPRSAVVDLIACVSQVADDEGLRIGVFGHAGDGNMHPTIIHDARDPASLAAAHRAFDRITAHALALGGTITGEHGVGRLKIDWLARELGETSLDVHRKIRAALDPEGVFNRGNLF